MERITTSPDQCGGQPCIRGMRIRVKDVLDLLVSGVSREDILQDYPYLEDADITACLEHFQKQQNESKDRSERLSEIDEGISERLKASLGSQWYFASDADRDKVLNQRQIDWESLRYFSKAYNNDGHWFERVGMIYQSEALFIDLGAHHMVAAAKKLRPYYDEMCAKHDEAARMQYWHETRAQREPIEEMAETWDEFEKLLLAFAEAHPEDLPVRPRQKVEESMDDYFSAFRDRIRNHFTREESDEGNSGLGGAAAD